MSRWLEQFNAHPFQATWLNLNTIANNLKVDDETIITSVKELARLKKAIAYIDGMISSIDPELVPMTTWDNFNSQATACSQEMQNFISNRNIGHIQNANNHIDNLLTYVRPYMVSDGKMGKVLHDSIKHYAKTIDEYINSFEHTSSELINHIRELSDQGKRSGDELKLTKQAIDEFNSGLFGSDGIEEQIKKLVNDFTNHHTSVTKLYNETLIGNENEPSTKQLISQAKEAILADQDAIKTTITDVNTKIEDLKNFHTKIFGSKNINGELSGDLEHELDTRIQILKTFENDQKVKYVALNTEIENLLPGATSAGLATAYKDMKDSFKEPIQHASYLFYGSICLLVFASVILTVKSIGGEHWISFVENGNWDEVLRGLINKLPFYGPILWLAYYASTRRSEAQRLQQEYAHKEALAKSYHSYKKQLEELNVDSEDLQKELIKKAINAIAHNASQTLDGRHGDKMPVMEILEKISSSISDNLGKSVDKVTDTVKPSKSGN